MSQQVQDLSKLFLRPRSIWARRRSSGINQGSSFTPAALGGGPGDGFDDGDGGFEGDNEADLDGFQDAMEVWGAPADMIQLAEAPRKIAKTEIGYSRAAKQVDVRALKELLWESLEGLSTEAFRGVEKDEGVGRVSFHDVLRAVPESNAAGALEDLSVHLCFICALHLANEHGLAISSGEGLDTLIISLPISAAPS
jgi:condensin complex subunit 2